MLYRIIIVILIISRFLTALGGTVDEPHHNTDVSERLRITLDYIHESATDDDDASKIGEWTVIALCTGNRNDDVLNERYLEYITERVRTEVPGKTPGGTLDEHKATENAKVVLALSAIGANPADIGGYDLTAPLENADWVCSGTLNGPVFALLALDASGSDDTDARDRLVDYILENQLSDGGWALSGQKSDPDITAMALQALVACNDRPDVKTSAHRAIDTLALLQRENGGYCSYGRENSESVSQVIIALCAWDIDLRVDDRFVKSGKTLLDVLTEYCAPDGGFYDVPDQNGFPSRMASEQAALALAAIKGLETGS